MPMVLIATAATIIASQAVISGAFSVTRQAVQLGFLPRLTVLHTGDEVGQVYVPAVNWGLCAAVIGLVLGFGSSQHLANAYGIAVTGTFAIDTVLFFFVVRTIAHKPLWMALLGAGVFLTVDLTFFAANLPKVEHGGWFPLAVALVIFVVLTTWQRGREIVRQRRNELEGSLEEFVEQVRAADHVARPPRTGVFLNSDRDTTPLALRTNYEHNHVVHRNVVIVSIQTLNVPHVRDEKRLKADQLGYDDDGICHLTARFGFQDNIDLPATLRAATGHVEGDIDLDAVTYFVSRVVIVPTRAPGMSRWRKRLFIAIARNASNPSTYLHLPDEDTVVMGAHIEI
jgi:KUP system potassium uptake protein